LDKSVGAAKVKRGNRNGKIEEVSKAEKVERQQTKKVEGRTIKVAGVGTMNQ